MADVSVQLGYKNQSWFDANPTFILLEGQKVHLLQTGTYKIGDGVTQLQNLSFLGNSGASSFTDITGDPYDNANLANALNDKADITYVDNEISAAVVGLLDDRGNYDASSNLFPSTGGSGILGAILKGDLWTISVAGILGGANVTAGDVVRALVDSPAQTASNWAVTENNIGYVPENNANKTNTVVGNEESTTLFLNIKGYYDYLVGLVWLTAQLFGTWINDLTSKTTPVDADYIPLMDSADSNKTKKISWANLKATLASTFFLDATSSIQTQINTKSTRVFKTTTDISHTGDTNNTLVFSQLISANTVTVGDVLEYRVKLRKSGTAGILTARVYVNTSASLSGATLIASRAVASASDNISVFERMPFVKSATNTEDLLATNTTVQTIAVSTTVGVTNSNIDWTVGQYFIIALQLGNSGDTGILSGAYLLKQ